MKCDVILSGVGGQGVLSVGAIIASAALRQGLVVKQSEVHGMAQRGGAVVCHLRISDKPIYSDIVPKGGADLIVSMEPVESLRYLPFLSKDGTLVTSTHPVENIPNYPDLDGILDKVREVGKAIVVKADELARKAGSLKAANVVLVGAVSHLLPISEENLLAEISERFAKLGPKMVETNIKALKAGREPATC